MMSNENERYGKLSDLEFKDLKELLFFIRNLDKSDDPVEVRSL